MDHITPTRATWNGQNASTWKIDLRGVNGFDERMAYGGEDRELGERLIHRGLRPRSIRHRAILVHLDHSRGYVNAAAAAANRVIWDETLRTRSTGQNMDWCRRIIRHASASRRRQERLKRSTVRPRETSQAESRIYC